MMPISVPSTLTATPGSGRPSSTDVTTPETGKPCAWARPAGSTIMARSAMTAAPADVATACRYHGERPAAPRPSGRGAGRRPIAFFPFMAVNLEISGRNDAASASISNRRRSPAYHGTTATDQSERNSVRQFDDAAFHPEAGRVPAHGAATDVKGEIAGLHDLP